MDTSSLDFVGALNFLKKKFSIERFTKLCFSWWHIWFARNRVLFANEDFIADTIFKVSESGYIDWIARITDSRDPQIQSESRPVLSPSPQFIHWETPKWDWFKLNFDGSKTTNGNAAIGFVSRDDKAKIAMMGSKSCGLTSVLVAEALTLKEGLAEAKTLGIRKLEIESDNLCLIQWIKANWKIPWRVKFIVEDIRRELLQLDDYTLRHVYREASSVADYLANIGHNHPSLTRWFESPILELSLLSRKNELGWTVLRH